MDHNNTTKLQQELITAQLLLVVQRESIIMRTVLVHSPLVVEVLSIITEVITLLVVDLGLYLLYLVLVR